MKSDHGNCYEVLNIDDFGIILEQKTRKNTLKSKIIKVK